MPDLLKVGRKAPAFSLVDQDENKVTFANDVKGHWTLLYFYPKAMTPGCTKQACSLRDAKRKLSNRKLKVFGVSADAPAKLKKFQEKETLNFPLLSDEKHTMLEKYGAWGEKKLYGRTFDGIFRISYLIDPDGKIAHAWPKVKTAEHADEVLAVFDELAKG